MCQGVDLASSQRSKHTVIDCVFVFVCGGGELKLFWVGRVTAYVIGRSVDGWMYVVCARPTNPSNPFISRETTLPPTKNTHLPGAGEAAVVEEDVPLAEHARLAVLLVLLDGVPRLLGRDLELPARELGAVLYLIFFK